MEGVTGMMAQLRHVPGCSRGGLYGPANIDFRFMSHLRLQRALYVFDRVSTIGIAYHVGVRDSTI